MSTRIHWGGQAGLRYCNLGNSIKQHRAVLAAEFLRLPNLCRICERAAQKSESLSVLRAFGAGKPKSLPAPQWPEPRPIKEAPKDGEWVLGWTKEDTKRSDDGWELIKWSPILKSWLDYEADKCFPTHFLPLPPKPERK